MSAEKTCNPPSIESLLNEIGEVGLRLGKMKACEGTAGNISVCLSGEIDPKPFFPDVLPYELPFALPELSGKNFLVTGSGCRLRDICQEPTANVGFLKLGTDGRTGRLFANPGRHFARLTSEFNSHLAMHQSAFHDPLTGFNAVVHAQPMHLTYLTHIKRYQDQHYLSKAVLRWQPELIVTFPFGFGYLPFRVPNSDELAEATRGAEPSHKLIVWEKHGVLAESNQNVFKALDLIEYVETGAHYEYLNLLNQEAGDGLLEEEIGEIRSYFNLPD